MSAGDASGDRASEVLIVTALREETDALIERAVGVFRVPGAPRPAWRGTLSGQPVILARTGAGPAHAAAGLAELLRALGPRRWIGAGLAGALAPDIAVGQLLIALAVRDAEGPVAQGPDPSWAARALACAPAARRRFVSIGIAVHREGEGGLARGGRRQGRRRRHGIGRVGPGGRTGRSVPSRARRVRLLRRGPAGLSRRLSGGGRVPRPPPHCPPRAASPLVDW